MIIQKISIENYLCYYRKNDFQLADGLNIILAENGEGKTKFYEAFEWLLNGSDNRGLDILVSARALEEKSIGDSFLVSVSMTVLQFEEKKVITRSFLATKTANNKCTSSNLMLEGVEENKQGERSPVDGQTLLDRIFPFQIRKYCMFKGESELNIFEKNDAALLNLINLFSDAKHFEKYSEKGAMLRERAEKAVEDASKSDKKNEALYKRLENEINSLDNEKRKYLLLLNTTEEEIRQIESNIQSAEAYVTNAETLDIINKRIKTIEEKIRSLNNSVDENYTTSLFDEKWITVNFEPIHHAFAEKGLA